MKTRRDILKLSLSAAAVVLVNSFGIAQAETKITPIWYNSGQVAANGYDPVAYFTMQKPVEGSVDHALNWQGAEWRFSSAEHKQMFEANPTKYAPQYGGHCAYAMARNSLAATVPEAWSVVDGKLYLNYSIGVRDRWDKDIPGYISKGDVNWPKH